MASKEQEKSFALEFGDCVTLTPEALDVAIEFFRSHLEPNDVFHKHQLDAWANANGYVQYTQSKS